jgi:hypothetical protein
MQATQSHHLVDTRSAAAFVLGAVIFAAGVGLGAVIGINKPAVSTPAAPAVTSVPAGDHRYDGIEDIRLGIGSTQVTTVPVGDHTYDAIEASRLRIGTAQSVTVPAGDRRYDAVEESRAAR